MKQIYLLLALSFGVTQGFSQTLFTFGTTAVSKDEFLRAYNKNKTSTDDKEKSLREYLDLYSKFKLKVKEAMELRLDTLQQLQYDLQSFRSQVEEGYMNDEKGLEQMLDEAFQRSQRDIHLLHFFVAVNDTSSSSDTAKAYNAIQDLYKNLSAGKNNYDELVKETSTRLAPAQKTDLGFITALSVPYTYENVAYNLKPGVVSKPFRTKTGWHIFKDLEERKSIGKWKVAQILFALPPNASAETIKAISNKADSVYGKLVAGEDFAAAAKKYSEDKLTYLNNGELPEFGTGRFEPSFENKVVELKNDGDISKPFMTSHGFHIVKRLQLTPTPSDKTDEGYLYTLKQQVLQNSRMNALKEKFVKDVLLTTKYTKNAAVKEVDILRFADSVTATGKIKTYPISNKVIFSFAKSSIKGSEWLNFVNDHRQNPDMNKGESSKVLWDKYVSATALDYYRKHLEEYNPAFKYQMQEFKEGNMLFEIMERNVWSKAANDSAGLVKYYNQHKAKYVWAESAVVILFNCNNEKTAAEAAAVLQSGKDWKKIAEESDGRIQADSGRYEVAQVQLPAGTTIKEGLISEPVLNSGDNTAGFVKVLKIFPANQQRTFEEARGLVINDYQNFLEEEWVSALKKKRPIKVNETVFQSLLK